MAGEGRPRSGITGWLTWREAIAAVGSRTDPEWDGTEQRAPTGAEEKAQIEKLLRADATAWAHEGADHSGEAIREQYLAALEAAYAPGPRRAPTLAGCL
jgi:hypothetical protein